MLQLLHKDALLYITQYCQERQVFCLLILNKQIYALLDNDLIFWQQRCRAINVSAAEINNGNPKQLYQLAYQNLAHFHVPMTKIDMSNNWGNSFTQYEQAVANNTGHPMIIKVVVMGTLQNIFYTSKGVVNAGKSTLLRRLTIGEFTEYTSNLGLDFVCTYLA